MSAEPRPAEDPAWPPLPLAGWEPTRATLHMWTQIAGKVRLALTPRVNHWWNVPLYVNSRGLTTSSIPYGSGAFEVQFDFLKHFLEIQCSDGGFGALALAPRSVADYYREFFAVLASLRIRVPIWPMPVEIPNPIRFNEDRVHATYDPEFAQRFWRVLVSVNSVFHEFRSHFIGKCSPVHFFWGEFRPGGDALFRPSRTRAPGRRRHDARSLFSRSQQRRILAGQRRCQRRCLLRLRRARTAGVRQNSGAPGRRRLQHAIIGIYLALRRRPPQRRSSRCAPRISPEHL
jgi:hypothetical protein